MSGRPKLYCVRRTSSVEGGRQLYEFLSDIDVGVRKALWVDDHIDAMTFTDQEKANTARDYCRMFNFNQAVMYHSVVER